MVTLQKMFALGPKKVELIKYRTDGATSFSVGSFMENPQFAFAFGALTSTSSKAGGPARIDSISNRQVTIGTTNDVRDVFILVVGD